MQRRPAAVAMVAATAFLLAPGATAWAPSPAPDAGADVVAEVCVPELRRCVYVPTSEDIDRLVASYERTLGRIADDPAGFATAHLESVQYAVQRYADYPDHACSNLRALDRVAPPATRSFVYAAMAACRELLPP